MLDKFMRFIKGKKDPATADVRIPFGRYSDNNKSVAKTNRWTEADQLFKEKKYTESIRSFFDYLKDDEQENVRFSGQQNPFSFEFYQGSKVVRGTMEDGRLSAEVVLAKMNHPSVPVMRRLLEMNFGLYYSRFAMHKDALCMRFDTHIETANPNKLYYGLKELAIKSDKHDDLLIQDFGALEQTDVEHISEIPDTEKQVKYDAMQEWIAETLEKTASVDADKFSAGISYLLLALVYRIDFLIAPEGQLLNDLEKISNIYFGKDEKSVVEKNRDMIEEFKMLQEKSKEEVFKNLFRSKYTFSIVAPKTHKTVATAIADANKNMAWYLDNNQAYFANKIIEYGLTFCQYCYSLPKPISQMIELFMHINYPEYFRSLGYTESLYVKANDKLNEGEIAGRIRDIQSQWKEKYTTLNFRTDLLNFTNLQKFNLSFATQIESLNMDN
ncbi:MAG TPA: hypothetical protein PK191_00725 [Niabella sp.]|nr:hypothetical protein [Niabella sp.]HOZ98246.1 hypothetical protein [Niabella sp.]HQW13194.1 hypothetical protein [Niabella sp.]HQX18766.1 hypothetical protein [Niabella sp.]HQX41156.1 hypothetical protein [Niabella sp.]